MALPDAEPTSDDDNDVRMEVEAPESGVSTAKPAPLERDELTASGLPPLAQRVSSRSLLPPPLATDTGLPAPGSGDSALLDASFADGVRGAPCKTGGTRGVHDHGEFAFRPVVST